MSLLRLTVIVEDIRFLDLLLPAARRLAAQHGVEIVPQEQRNLRGCRPALLADLLRNTAETDLTLVGADAMGQAHGGSKSRSTYRKKGRGLTRILGDHAPATSLAIAEPSVEAWLMADLDALRSGLSGCLGHRLQSAEARPFPTSERQAKNLLGRTIQSIVGEPLARSGFEYAEAIVAEMDLTNSRNESLREWARSFDRLITRQAT